MNNEIVKIWLARDEGGYCFAYKSKPKKYEYGDGFGQWASADSLYFDKEFEKIKWENKVPTEAYITLKNPSSKSILPWHDITEEPQGDWHIVCQDVFDYIWNENLQQALMEHPEGWDEYITCECVKRWVYLKDIINS